MLRFVAVLTVLAALTACSTSGDDDDTLARLRGEEVVDATSANATVVERTTSPCGGTARSSDGWAEVTWAFTSPDPESIVLEQFESKVTTVGWSAASGSDYGHNVLLFKKGESQLRLHPATPDFAYQVILESPC